MTQVRTKEEFVGSLELVPSFATSREPETSINGKLKADGDISILLPEEEKGTQKPAELSEALVGNQLLTQDKNSSSVILVSSKQAQRGVMNIFGQTILKIDSGKGMIVVPGSGRASDTFSTLPAIPHQTSLAGDQSKQLLPVKTTAYQCLPIIPESELTMLDSDQRLPVLSNCSETTTIKSSLATNSPVSKVTNDKQSSSENGIVYGSSRSCFEREGAGMNGDDNSLKDLLKKELGGPTDNLNMLAHVSNQIFGADQRIVYKKITLNTDPVLEAREDDITPTKICTQPSATVSSPLDRVSYTVGNSLVDEVGEVSGVGYAPEVKVEPVSALVTNNNVKGNFLQDEGKLDSPSGTDFLKRRRKKLMNETGNLRGRRVGHPFNPNSLPPPPDSPACGTCVLFEHTLLKMATRGFWGGNKGCLEDVFRSIRVEGTDITDTVEDVTRRCYEFVRKKLLDLKDRRNDAFMYMRSYIDEFDGFLERVPPVAVVAMVIYLPMAADYELVTWHGVPPTGWSEYRRAVIMREVFEVLYQFGTQTKKLPEYDQSYFKPRSQTKMLKERVFDMRQDGSVKGWVVNRRSYSVIYSDNDFEGDKSTSSSSSPCDTTAASGLQSHQELQSTSRNNISLRRISPEDKPGSINSEEVLSDEIASQESPEAGNKKEDGVLMESAKVIASDTEHDPGYSYQRRTSKRRRTRNSLRLGMCEETSDCSSLGGDEDIDAHDDLVSVEGNSLSQGITDVAGACESPTETEEKLSVITPQLVESIVSACGNSNSWRATDNASEKSESCPESGKAVSKQCPRNEVEVVLLSVQQSVVFESLWTKKAPDEPKIVQPDGTEMRFGDYLSIRGVETSCPQNNTIMIVNGVSYRAKEVLGYFRRGVQFVEHTREHGTTIDTMTTMKESIKSGAVRKIPPGKISKLVHPNLHLENYTTFILPIGVPEGGGLSFKRKGFRQRLKRPRQRCLDGFQEMAVEEEELSPKRLFSSEVSSSTANEGRNISGSVPLDINESQGQCGSPLPFTLARSSAISGEIKEEAKNDVTLLPSVHNGHIRQATPPEISAYRGKKDSQMLAPEEMQSDETLGLVGQDINVRLATSITNGIFNGFKDILQENSRETTGGVSQLHSIHSLIDSYKKAGRFLLEMAENLETILSSDTFRKSKVEKHCHTK